MEVEHDSNSCFPFGNQTQKLNQNDYYSNHTVTFGEDLSKFQQYHTPFNTFLQNNNINMPNQQMQTLSGTNSSQQSYSQLQQTPYFCNNNQTPQQGVNIFAQQNNQYGGQQIQPFQSQQSGVNIFAQSGNVNQGVNVFASSQNIFSSQNNNNNNNNNNNFNNNNNANGFNVFSNIPLQQPQNPFARNGVPLNQLANNLFPQIDININQIGFNTNNLNQAVQEQDEDVDGDYDPTDKGDDDAEEGDFNPGNQEDDDGQSSGTSCDEDENELNDCLNDVDDKSFNLQEYLRMRDQL